MVVGGPDDAEAAHLADVDDRAAHRATAGWVRVDPSTQVTRVGTSPQPSRTPRGPAAPPDPASRCSAVASTAARVGMSAVEPLALAAQRVGEPVAGLARPRLRGQRPHGGARARSPTGRRAPGEQQHRTEQREEQQLRTEEDGQGDADGHRSHGRDPRDPRPRAARGGLRALDLELLGAHRARRRRGDEHGAVTRVRAPEAPRRARVAAAGSTTPTTTVERASTASRHSTRTPVDDDPVGRPAVLDRDARRPDAERARGPGSAPRRRTHEAGRRRPPDREARRGQRAGAPGIRATDHDEVEHAGRAARRPLPPRPWHGRGDGDRRTVQEGRHPDHGVGRERAPAAQRRHGLAEVRRPVRAHRSAAVCAPDHSTTTSTGWGRRRGRCTVSVISMAATVGSPTDDPRSYPQVAVARGAKSAAAPVRYAARRSLVGGGVRPGRRGRGRRPHARGRGARADPSLGARPGARRARGAPAGARRRRRLRRAVDARWDAAAHRPRRRVESGVGHRRRATARCSSTSTTRRSRRSGSTSPRGSSSHATVWPS